MRDFPSLTDEQIEFGYVPDRRNLFPGDLILFQPIKPDIEERISRWAQGSDWTHAAIYARYWRIFEATPNNNISVGDLMPYITKYKILVRRPNLYKTLADSNEAMLKGHSIAIEAALHVNSSKYSKKSALKAGLRAMLKMQSPRIVVAEMQRESLICSGLYAKCFEIATEVQLLTNEMRHNGEPVTPSLLSRLTALYDVDVGWTKLDPDL